MSTRQRFVVSDAVCGFIEGFGRRLEALDCARRHWRQHLDDGTHVLLVTDMLARYGAVNLWHVNRHGRCEEAGRKEPRT